MPRLGFSLGGFFLVGLFVCDFIFEVLFVVRRVPTDTFLRLYGVHDVSPPAESNAAT